MESTRLKIIVIRPDRVGDVILSTPVFEVLKQHYPDAHLTVMVKAPVAPLIQGLPYVDQVVTYDPEGRHRGINGFFDLIREFREGGYRIAVVLQSQLRIAAALYGAGVRYRVGPKSKPHSFLFYNRGVRQRRSHVEMHETDYNLELLRRLGVRTTTRSILPRVALSTEAKEKGFEFLKAQGFKLQSEGGKPLIAVHPGMGGSALNWPEEHYLALIKKLLTEDYQVLITAGPTEGQLLDTVKKSLTGSQAERVIFYGGPLVGPIDELGGVLHWAQIVIAPSTGPLHMAVALGKRVISFFPPIRVQSAIRWGPYVKKDSDASVLAPEVYCGEDFRCRGTLCNYYPCMRTITVEQVMKELKKVTE